MQVESFEHNGYKVTLSTDDYPYSPDDWGDDSILIVTTRNRYFEKHPDVCGYKGMDANTLADRDVLREVKRDYHVLPLQAYIHSGVALSLYRGRYPFDCPWDSGQIGFVLVKKRQGFRNIRKAAESHVETWNQYLSGDVYEYLIEQPDGEFVDSLCGLYGWEYAKEEALGAVPDEPARELGDGDDIGMYEFEEATG